MGKNKGFVFYQNFWDSIENLPEEQKKEICYAIVKYGITGEMVNKEDNPMGFTMANAFKLAIDNSTGRFNNNVVAGVRGGRPKKLDGKALADYLLENPNVTARTAAEYFGVSESTIQKREEWRNRKYLAGGYAF